MTNLRVRLYARSDLEWCGGRMAHLRVKGESRTICGADPKHFPDDFLARGGLGHRPTLTDAEAAEQHQCKHCLKRVAP